MQSYVFIGFYYFVVMDSLDIYHIEGGSVFDLFYDIYLIYIIIFKKKGIFVYIFICICIYTYTYNIYIKIF